MKIDTTHAEYRQWIKENLEDLTFDEKTFRDLGSGL